MLANLALEIFENMSEAGDIQVSAALPKLGAAVIKVRSEGLNQMLKKGWAWTAENKLKGVYEEFCPNVYEEKKQLGKPGYYRRNMWTKYDNGDGFTPGIANLRFEIDGQFVINVDYSGGSEYNSAQTDPYYGQWKSENNKFEAPDKN